MEFLYNSQLHSKENGPANKLLLRICGGVILVIVLSNVWEGIESWDWLDIVSNIILFLFSIVMLFHLDYEWMKWPNKTKTIRIEGETLRWKLGKEENFLDLNQVLSYHQNTSDVIFLTDSGEKVKLETHEIENRGKWEEFMTYIRERFSR